MENKLNKIFIILFIFFSSINLYSENFDVFRLSLGIITGDNVNLRDAPSIEGKILNRLLKNEIVFFIEKNSAPAVINGEKFFWIKIRTQNKNEYFEGWVFGKYFYDFSDKNYPGDKISKEIINQFFYKKLFSGYRFYYSPMTRIINYAEKDYYIFTIKLRDIQNKHDYDSTGIYIETNLNKYYNLTSFIGTNNKFAFYDLDKDGFAEIIVENLVKKTNIIIVSSRDKKIIFSKDLLVDYKDFSIESPEKLYDSYIVIDEINNGKHFNIVVNIRDDPLKSMRKIFYFWDGKTFIKK